MPPAPEAPQTTAPQGLRRSLGLWQVVLYGLGVTIGAGIYALVGPTVAIAASHAPMSFVLAALVMALPAACFAELTGRLPFAAAEAQFVRAGFGARWLFVTVGLGVALIGMVSAAAIAHGAAGYLRQFLDLPLPVMLMVVVAGCGLVAARGVATSVGIAGAMTLIEIGGLVLIIAGGVWSGRDLGAQAMAAVPLTLSAPVWAGILAAGLIAVFAFVGFENIGSVAEETRAPQRTLARGIFLTLGITTVLYLGVMLTVLATLTPAEVQGGTAPLTLTFTRNSGLPEALLAAIAVAATVNGVVVQFLMAARVLYGLAREGALPAALAQVDPHSASPVRTTALAVAVTLALALAFPIEQLAEGTSAITLVIFALVCLALARIHARGDPAPKDTFRVPRWVPPAGALACVALLIAGLAAGG